ncbi:MAG: DPP IV N-terminal domain-containing protein [Bacteroidetes bacterium]|nr:DPP IV N-terminal domain-containing protein [Bacteroidota bacterium]
MSTLKLLFTALVCLLILPSFAQTKLTLEDAVLQQYRKFASDNLFGFAWVPNTDCYSYLEAYRTLKKASFTNTEAKTVLTIDEVNTALNVKLPWFTGFKWLSENEFSLSDGSTFVTFDIVSKTGKVVATLADDAENALMDHQNKHIAYTRNNNVYLQLVDGQKIKVTTFEDLNIVSGQSFARNEFGISGGLFWSPKSTYLAFYQKDETNVSNYPLLDNSKTPGELKNIKYPMAGQGSEKPRVGIYNIASKNTIYISPRGKEDSYLTNLSWTPDGKYVLIAEVNREQNEMGLHMYNAETGEFVRTLLVEKNEKWVEPEHPALFPDPNSNNFIWVSEKSGFNNLYYYDINGKLIKQLTKNDFVVKDLLFTRKEGTEIYFSATGESPLNTMVYKVDLKGKQELITKTPGVHSVQVSTDGAYVFDQFSSHSIPGMSVIYDSKGKKEKVLIQSPNKYEGIDIGTTEIGQLKAKDGSVLYTRLIKPKNFDASKKYPVLVYVYGGPHAQMITNSWMDGASLWMHWMADQGYLVFTLDNRGSAERGFAFESQIHRQLGTLEMEDQLTGVDYLKSLPFVDQERMAVHGWSFGGFMTTSLMLRKPGTFTTGVAGGPVTDWKFYEIMYGERYMDQPEENTEGYKKASLFSYTDQLKGKLFLIHGSIDDVVVMQHSLSLMQQFVEQGIQMDFFTYPMHKHNVGGKDRVHLMRNVLNYILENNQ